MSQELQEALDPRSPTSASMSSRAAGKRPVNASSSRNPRWVVSDGYAYAADTASFEYRRVDDMDDVDPLGMEQGLDISGVCADPTGRWLYVGTTRNVVEWGLV